MQDTLNVPAPCVLSGKIVDQGLIHIGGGRLISSG